jgi:hypothetical protein
MENQILYTKLSTLPEDLKSEVSDFIDFLLSKAVKDKMTTSTPKPKFGSAKGMFKINPDFDEPLEDFKDYMN